MTKKTKIIAITAGVAVIGLAIGIRLLLLVPYPMGEHNYLESPNEKHRAYVHRLTDKDFFGGTREFYRFEVRMQHPNGDMVTVFEKDIPPAYIQISIDLSDLEAFVVWSHDSIFVTYFLGDRDIEVAVPFTG